MKTQQSKNSSDIVRRRIEIPALASDADAMMLEQALDALPGLASAAVDIAKHHLEVEYDAARIDYQTIMKTVESAGFSPSHGLSSRLRGSVYQFLDSNARDNAKAPPPACCNKPPK
ncbi:MAG TPA: cation transporter [Armatimonadetes bacterium]|nr:cation transporter [Armatimonadota bacterium]